MSWQYGSICSATGISFQHTRVVVGASCSVGEACRPLCRSPWSQDKPQFALEIGSLEIGLYWNSSLRDNGPSFVPCGGSWSTLWEPLLQGNDSQTGRSCPTSLESTGLCPIKGWGRDRTAAGDSRGVPYSPTSSTGVLACPGGSNKYILKGKQMGTFHFPCKTKMPVCPPHS